MACYDASKTAIPTFGPSPLVGVFASWELRRILSQLGTARGHFTCDDLGDPKLNPPDDDDVATPIIVEADPPR